MKITYMYQFIGYDVNDHIRVTGSGKATMSDEVKTYQDLQPIMDDVIKQTGMARIQIVSCIPLERKNDDDE